MKLYNSIGPNPKVVRMFMAEKGIEVPKVEIDLMGGENRREPYVSKNPSGTMPALELDNGSVLAEITAICEYLDEKHPGGNLIGTTAEERAETRMWARRIDLGFIEPMTNGFRYSDGLKLFQSRVHCIPAAANDLKQVAKEKLTWLDKLMGGKNYICGERFSLADILLFSFLEFGARVGQPLDPANATLAAWYERVKQRPSAKA